jgi:bifunctional UDP-N-acetylglucosamine pyrophosphorylase / glucosamine-1-phosphate N-acetyltransferase
MARPVFEAAAGYVAVIYGDHPLLRARNFEGVLARLEAGMDAAILGFEPADPTGYGRFITEGERLLAIREHKDASETERAIGLCNACILAFRADVFRALIDKVGSNNAQGEFYLTDLVELANAAGYKVGYSVSPENDVLGVNDRAQLARAEGLFQEVRREEFMKAGVTLKDPASVYFSWDTEIGQDVTIEPHVVFGPGVRIGRNVDRSRLLAHRRRGAGRRCRCRAVRAHAGRQRARRERASGQFRRGQECADRGRHQGGASELSR